MDGLYSTKVTERVYMLDTYALGVPRTVGAYAIKGPKPALVDCGYPTSYESVLAGLAEVGVSPTDVRYVIPTHVHLDHAGAAGRLLKEMPNAEVVTHEKGVKHLVDPTKLMESVTKVFGPELVELYGTPEPVPSERITAVGEEMALDLGDGMTATIMHAPGHAPHQVSVMLDRERALLTADAVGIVYPGLKTLIPTTPPPSFYPTDLLSTVRALRQMKPSELLVPHFGIRGDPEWVFEKTSEKVSGWVDRVRILGKKGMSLDDIAELMETEVEKEAGVEDLEIYAKVSIRASVMGIMHFLSKAG